MSEKYSTNPKKKALFLILGSLLSLSVLSAAVEDETNSIIKYATAQLPAPANSPNVSSMQSRGDQEMETCIDPYGFSIDYPKSWSHYVNTCTFFSPTLGQLVQSANQSYVRISSYKNWPVLPLDKLALNIKWLTNSRIFKTLSINPYNLRVGNAVQLVYAWNKSTSMLEPPQTVLPFVNLSMAPTTPAIIPLSNLSGNNTSHLASQNNTKGVVNQQKTPYITEVTSAIYFNAKNSIYVIEYTAPDQNFTTYLPQATKMINSFEWHVTPSNNTSLGLLNSRQ